tara:strand:- start:652 stop:996 length:345 start_codon:yes stop_codon:yes gene_type:complete
MEVIMESNNDMFYNDRKSEKNFVDWAYDKIAEEMKRIEKLEEEFGTSEHVLPKRDNKSPVNLTEDEQMKTILDIDKLREEGYSSKLAAELCNIAPSTYTKWKRKFKARLGKPQE